MSNAANKGDVDCNGSFASPDISSTLGYIAGAGAPGCLASSDINCDSAVSVPDVMLMLKKQTNLPLDLPGGCSF